MAFKARPSVGPRVTVDGLDEYKKSISEINAANKTMNAELKLLQAQYKGNTESAEYLAKKGEILQTQLDRQREKVEQLRSAMQLSAKTNGEANTETQALATQYANAQRGVLELEDALKENTAAMNGENKAMAGLGDTVDSLASKFGINIPDGAKKALNGISSLSKGTVVAMTAAAAGVALLIKSVKELQQQTLEAAARADDIMARSTQMGISAQQYMQLQYASPFVDVDVDTMAKSLQKLTKVMGEAASGGEAAKKQFSDLGVSIQNTDGSLRSSYDVWLDTMDAIAGITGETERDVAAQALLGKSAAELATIYRDGTDALREYSAAAEENYVMTDEQLEKLGAVDDAWQQLQLDIESNKNMIAAQWAPTAKEALEAFDKLVKAAGKALVDSGLIEGFGNLLQLAIHLLDPVTNLLEKANEAPEKLRPVQQAFNNLALVIAAAADTLNWLLGLLQSMTIIGMFSDFGTGKTGLQRMGYAQGSAYNYGAPNNLQRQTMINNGTWDQYASFYGLNAGGTDNWRGGYTWVGEAGPELALLPAGTQIMNAQDSRGLGGDVINISVDVGSLEDLESLIRWAKGQKIRGRMR